MNGYRIPFIEGSERHRGIDVYGSVTLQDMPFQDQELPSVPLLVNIPSSLDA
jgi:hypothetical protein